MKKAFTILELMAVVAILGILLGIVVSAAANSVRLAREQKTSVTQKVIQQGLETYHIQKDEWPGILGEIANKVDQNKVDNGNYVISEPVEVKRTIGEVVKECVHSRNPMMDISGLFVSRDQGNKDGTGLGLDFWEAVRGSERSKKKMSISEMYYGYPESSHGYFRSFRLSYSVPTDSVEVKTR